MTGQTLSHYQIDAELGRGGMGVVYRATDTKLNRTVALKVLPAAALASPDDRARFVREAQSAAQLNHPNIATVHGIDEAVPEGEGAGGESRLFIAMEYIEGETLREHAQKGPMKLQQAVSIAGQIAEALKVAHAKDIVHRDIKSANIMLTADGVAKVLDFGLAKTNASTMLTRMGSTLGTVAYMSPEQARGQEVDGRSDLYSLGTVLYEMVAGVLPFAGDYEQAVLYSILNEPPEPLTAIRTGVPMQLERVVNKLLAKEAEYRYQTAADLLADLKSLDLDGSGMSRRSMPAMPAAPLGRPGVTPRWVWPALAAAFVLGGLVFWLLKPVPASPSGAPVQLALSTGELRSLWGPSLSEDGRFAAFSARDRWQDRSVWLADMVDGNLTQLGRSSTVAAFSPESNWVVYSADEGIYRASVVEGTPVLISEPAFFPRFLTEDVLLVNRRGVGVLRMSVDGENQTRVFSDTLLGYTRTVATHSLGDGERVLLSLARDSTTAVAIGRVSNGSARVLVENAMFARYVSSGHLLYLQSAPGRMQAGPLLTRPFDADSETFSGPAVPLTPQPIAWSAFDATRTGGMVMLGGTLEERRSSLSWYLRSTGQQSAFDIDEGWYHSPAISADGLRIALERENEQDESDVWLIDVAVGTSSRLTFGRESRRPDWSSDGRHIFFDAHRGADRYLMLRKRADGSGTEESAFHGRTQGGWLTETHDWRVYIPAEPANQWDLMVEHRSDSTLSRRIVREGIQSDPVVSPVADYVAFANQSAGELDILVQDLRGDAFWSVAVAGTDNRSPRWSWDGTELYYRSQGALWVVKVEYEPTFRRVGRPTKVFEMDDEFDYAVHPDGDRILVITEESGGQQEVNVRINLQEYLRGVAPPTQ